MSTPEWLQRVRERREPKKRAKGNHIGAPAVFLLEQACAHVNAAFCGWGCYQVGSTLERADWRDVDVRYLMEDAEFLKLFPDVEPALYGHCIWERDPRWLLLTTSISAWMKQQTGLPVDFQIWPQSAANERFGGKRRNPIGFRIAPRKAARSD